MYMLLVMLPSALIALFAQWRVKRAMSKWSRVPNERGLTGVETARVIMRHTGLEHVELDRVPGDMTDHYDPRDKSIHLSETSTQYPSVASMAIVAHELGHAQQDQTGNPMLRLRATLVPAAGIGTQLGMILVIIGLVIQQLALAWVGVILFSAFVLFTVVTLPVEFDASRRAKAFLRETNLVSANEAKGDNEVLNAAALTYVAAAAGAILQLLYFVSLISGGRRN